MIAVYLRVSTDQQDTAAQRGQVERYLDGHGWTIPPERWYIDEGVSGATMRRPDLERLQRDVFDGRVKTVVFYALDRFARDMIAGLGELDRWAKSGCRMIFVADSLDVDPASWAGQIILKVMVTLRLAWAEMERAKIRERQAAGFEAARKKQARARQLRDIGWTLERISEYLSTPKRPVSQLQVKAMLEAEPDVPWWNVREVKGKHLKRVSRAKIEHLKALGHSVEDIARVCGVSRKTVYRRMAEKRLSVPSGAQEAAQANPPVPG